MSCVGVYVREHTKAQSAVVLVSSFSEDGATFYWESRESNSGLLGTRPVTYYPVHHRGPLNLLLLHEL